MQHLQPEEFLNWLGKARPGQVIVVYRGRVGQWCNTINNRVMRRVQAIIEAKRDQHIITTFHRRFGPNDFGLEAHVLGIRARIFFKKRRSHQ